MSVEIARRLFSVDDFYRMAAAGILGEDDRVELIRGEVVEMPPIGPRHASVVDRLAATLAARVPQADAIVRVQSPVRLDERSEPLPDLALLAFRPDFYAEAHPGAADCLLLVEVADTSAGYDRQLKLPLYARAGVAEVWLVDIPTYRVEVYRDPSPEGYRTSFSAGRDESISPLMFPGLSLAVADLLG